MDTSPVPLHLPRIGSSPAALAAAARTGGGAGPLGAARRHSSALAVDDFAPTPAPAVLDEHELLCSQARAALPPRAACFLSALQLTDYAGFFWLREMPCSAACPVLGGGMGEPRPDPWWAVSRRATARWRRSNWLTRPRRPRCPRRAAAS